MDLEAAPTCAISTIAPDPERDIVYLYIWSLALSLLQNKISTNKAYFKSTLSETH